MRCTAATSSLPGLGSPVQRIRYADNEANYCAKPPDPPRDACSRSGRYPALLKPTGPPRSKNGSEAGAMTLRRAGAATRKPSPHPRRIVERPYAGIMRTTSSPAPTWPIARRSGPSGSRSRMARLSHRGTRSGVAFCQMIATKDSDDDASASATSRRARPAVPGGPLATARAHGSRAREFRRGIQK